MKCLGIILIFLCFYQNGLSQPRTDSSFQSLLNSSSNSVLQRVLSNPDLFGCQIIYTQIDRDRNNIPHFTQYYFHFDSLLYFNPASMVKMPLAFLALEKLNTINDIHKNTPLQIDSSYPAQTIATIDATSKNGLPSISHYIKKAFLVSDNDAYNRMYQFVGQKTINQNLHNKGYARTKIIRQFMGFTDLQNRHTNPIRFLKENGQSRYTQPPAYNTDSIDNSKKIFVGKGFYNRAGNLINEPFDFSAHNFISLYDMQQMLQSVIFPKSAPPFQRFNHSRSDRKFLLQYLSQYPSETNFPNYDTTEYFDSFVKLFFRDSTQKIPKNIRVFNKVGWAYGFMTDVSYIADFKNKIEYMLSATIYVNSDGILNDDKYEYSEIAYPFFNAVGHTIYQHELKRKRQYRPTFADIQVKYEKRIKN